LVTAQPIKKGRRVFVIFLVLRTKKITKTLPFFWLAEQLRFLITAQSKNNNYHSYFL